MTKPLLNTKHVKYWIRSSSKVEVELTKCSVSNEKVFQPITLDPAFQKMQWSSHRDLSICKTCTHIICKRDKIASKQAHDNSLYIY